MTIIQRVFFQWAVLFASVTAGLATDCTWTGAGGNSLWTNKLNWANSTSPTSNADTATFPANTSNSVLIDTNQTVKTIYFRNPGMTLTVAAGANLALDDLGALALYAAEDAVMDGDGTLTLSVNTGENYADNQALTGKTLTINTKITGTNGFEFNGGGGTLVLANAANDYPGNTLMTSSGTLSVPSIANAGVACPLGKGSAFKFTTSSTTFRYTGTGDSTDRTFYQNGSASQDVTVEHAGSGTLTFTGPFLSGVSYAHSFIFVVDAADAIIENKGVISNGGTAALGLYKQGLGTQYLSATNTYTGNTLVDAGTLAIKPSGAISTSSLIRMRGGALLLNAGTPASSYTAAFGTLQVESGASSISVASGATSAQITFSSITYTDGGIDFSADGLGTTTKIFITGQANGLIGPWATVNGGTVLAAYSSAQGVYATDLPVQALKALGPSSITNNASSTARITDIGTSGGISLADNPTEVALLSQETNTDALVSFGGYTLRLPRAQIVDGAASLTLGDTAGDGVLTAPVSAAGKLVLDNENASSAVALTVNATVTNNGATAVRLEKFGAGNVTLAGPVGHTGGTYINTGMLTLFTPSNTVRTLPSGVIAGNGGLTLTGMGTSVFYNVANTYAGTTTVAQGTARILNSTTFGSSAGPTVISNGGAVDFVGTGSQSLNLNAEAVYAEGTGPDGLGALRNTGSYSQYNAIRLLTLSSNLTVYTPQRLDVRNASGNSTLDFGGHGITKRGGNYFGLTGVTTTNDQGTAFVDILEGYFTLEVATTLSGGSNNFIRVRNGGTFDFYQVQKPINWSFNLDNGGRLYTRNGYSTNLNIVAGPVAFAGRALFDSAGPYSDTYAGDVSGIGPLVKIGNDANVTYLRGTNNTWTGGTIISNGTLYAAAYGSLPNYATDVTVANYGCLAFRVADAAATQPGWSLDQINTVINNGTTFLSSTTSVGFDTAYEDLNYTAAFPALGLRKFGPNTLTLSGTGDTLGPVRVYGGTLDLSPASRNLGDQSILIGESTSTADPLATLTVGGTAQILTTDKGYNVSGPQLVVGDNGRGTLKISDDATIQGRLLVGNGQYGVGAVYQTGGTVRNTSGASNDGRIGVSGYGYYRLSDGVLTNSGYTEIAQNSTSYGFLEQTGGTFIFGASYGGTVGVSRGGTGVVYIAGGRFINNAALEIGDDSDNNTTNGYASVTITGSAVVTNLGPIQMGNRNNMTAALLNLNGGDVSANTIWRAGRIGTDVWVNWNGGVYHANSSDSDLFSGGVAGVYPSVTLYGGGSTIDIPDTTMNKTISTPLCAPQGLGLTSIPVATAGTNYLGAPFVAITGGGGVGASAYAHIDPVSGTLTSIEITSPGTGFTNAPTVSLIGGGATTSATLGTPVMGLSTSGGLTKLGSGTLTLNATNTYTGPTEVREGTLRLKNVAALSPLSAVSITGGSLDLGGGTLSNGNVTVTGGTIVNGRIATKVIDKNGPGTLDLSSLVMLSTNRAQRALTPGLWEGMVRSSWDTATPNPCQAIMLTPRAAIGYQALNTTYAGGLWNGNYHTYIYSGYIWNRATTNETWSFRGRFDDNIRLVLDGAILINAGNSSAIVTNALMTPGPHAIELRFGDGTGSAGPTGEPYGIAYDPLGRASTSSSDYRQLLDPGDGSLLTLDLPEVYGPGLKESFILETWNTSSNGTVIGRQLTTRAGNGAIDSNAVYANGMWRGNNHTWIYSGYIWNRTDSDETWTWRFTFDDNVRLMIDSNIVKNVTLGNGIIYQNYTLSPGPHAIEIRFGDGTGNVGPASGLGGLTYDPQGRGSTDLANYILLQDSGDGALLTTDVEAGEPVPTSAAINVNEGTLRLASRPVPGLWEGRIDNKSFDTTTPNPSNTVELTTTAANGYCGENGTINGKLWPTNTTYVYTGYIWNRTGSDATWTFAENFDDSVKLTIDTSVLISGGSSWNIPTKGTITLAPGAHAFEVRFGQGIGGAAGNSAQWWTNNLMSFAVDWQGRDSTNLNNYAIPADPGDGSIFTCSLADPQVSTDLLAEVTVTLADGTALDLNGGIYAVGLLTGSGTVSNGTLAAGTVISPAGDDAVGTLALEDISLSEGVVYRLTVFGAACDLLTSTGTLDFSGASIVASTDPNCTVSTYVIAHADGGITGTKPTVSGFPSKYKIIRKGTDLLLTSQGGTVLTLE